MNELRFDNRRARVNSCPCGKSNKDGKFSPYKGYDDKGYCHSCGETFLPTIDNNKQPFQRRWDELPKQMSYVPDNLFKGGLIGDKTAAEFSERNNFAKYLVSLFGDATAKEVMTTYYLGTTKHWLGANIFWQVDKTGKPRAGKIMQYDPTTGKRRKDLNPTWV
ncbi:MAG: hypothetical protein J7502_16945, partial [Flavisolibacter sp.]|nr:hypothetical protein [Flavisolibacter sp.]